VAGRRVVGGAHRPERVDPILPKRDPPHLGRPQAYAWLGRVDPHVLPLDVDLVYVPLDAVASTGKTG